MYSKFKMTVCPSSGIDNYLIISLDMDMIGSCIEAYMTFINIIFGHWVKFFNGFVT